MRADEVAKVSPTILVIDHDDLSRERLAPVLKEAGYRCVEASSPSEARALLDGDPTIAAVFCNVDMNGDTARDVVRMISDFPDLPLIATSSDDDSTAARHALEVDAYGYMVKPFSPNEALINLTSVLRRRHAESTGGDDLRSLEGKISKVQEVRLVRETLEATPPDEAMARETIERLSRTVSLRDVETGSHIERVSLYSALLAERMGFAGASSQDVRVASALHDVGKIGVPDSILLKPGPLDADEQAVMQGHTQIGYRLLAGSSSPLIELCAGVALCHHEWWDGGGYPQGLQGERIPRVAQITAVADVFDALTSNQVYRPAMPVEDAVEIMVGVRGRRFDPHLLDAFVAALDDVSSIRDVHPEPENEELGVRVLLVDDHEIFAESLTRLLSGKEGIRVVGRAGTCAQAHRALALHRPDVVLMDFELPDGDGATAAREMRMALPTVKVIMLTARTDDETLARALEAGCSGFVTKTESTDKLIKAIRGAHIGEYLVPPDRLQQLLGRMAPTRRGLGSTLTRRELEVLRMLAAGLSNKEIAKRLFLSTHTVRNHVQRILNKLQAHSKLEAVAVATREGVLRPDSVNVRS
jgi:putative two-component system response regulator